eukprot:gnl/Spiro4/11393_TR6014_c0_g1_i1.p1 gnl/Spiro4/11393_TR6014_c0_g1~~gnl/Spiro4/11393_TR6014_c0_g1_i1.p1  ORF type:complete len:763 (+),score=198.34 gnl/Spiro4/11393_TR6014_c0_g1_i1:76-2289(+)
MDAGAQGLALLQNPNYNARIDGDDVVFESRTGGNTIRVPRSSPCPSFKSKSDGRIYALDVLCFLALHRNANWAEYSSACEAQKVERALVFDRQAFHDFLKAAPPIIPLSVAGPSDILSSAATALPPQSSSSSSSLLSSSGIPLVVPASASASTPALLAAAAAAAAAASSSSLSSFSSSSSSGVTAAPMDVVDGGSSAVSSSIGKRSLDALESTGVISADSQAKRSRVDAAVIDPTLNDADLQEGKLLMSRKIDKLGASLSGGTAAGSSSSASAALFAAHAPSTTPVASSGSATSTATAEALTTLGLAPSQVAVLRAKFQASKRAMVASTDAFASADRAPSSATGVQDKALVYAKATAAATERVQARERLIRSRKSVLQCKCKTFESVLVVLNDLKKKSKQREEQRRKQQLHERQLKEKREQARRQERRHAEMNAAASEHKPRPQPGSTPSRSDMPGAVAPSPHSHAPPHHQHPQQQPPPHHHHPSAAPHHHHHQQPHHHAPPPAGAVVPSSPAHHHPHHPQQPQHHHQQQQQHHHHHHPSASSSSAPPHHHQSSSAGRRTGAAAASADPLAAVPIIVVPAAHTAKLNMYNVEPFLTQALYVSPEERRQAGTKREPMIVIKKNHAKLNAKTTTYHIVDNTSKFTSAEWARTVAVIMHGPFWQFNDWPWKTPPEVFSHVRGFYFRYDDEMVSPVRQWDVKTIMISKTKRHLDSPAVLEFWSELERYIITQRPLLNVHKM